MLVVLFKVCNSLIKKLKVATLQSKYYISYYGPVFQNLTYM